MPRRGLFYKINFQMTAYDCCLSSCEPASVSGSGVELLLLLTNGSNISVPLAWPVRLPSETVFTVRYFGTTLLDGRMQTALITDCFISNLCNIFMFRICEDSVRESYHSDLIGHLSVVTNISLPSTFFVNGHFALLPGRSRVIVLDFKSEKARVVKFGIKSNNESPIEERIIPVQHSLTTILIQQSLGLSMFFASLIHLKMRLALLSGKTTLKLEHIWAVKFVRPCFLFVQLHAVTKKTACLLIVYYS